MSSFTDIKSVDSMILFLQEKGKNHENYYHYTTWDAVKKIISGTSFLLTRGNSLAINDQHEAHMQGSWDEWNKTYIGSFAFGSAENMAMWGLYGLPWSDAVRLTIPKDKMNVWVNSIKQINLFENGKTAPFRDSFDVSLNDVAYVSEDKGVQKYSHYGRHITASKGHPLYGMNTLKEMTGYVKNYAWQYENEVRMRIHLHHSTGYEKILIDVPEEVINSIEITVGPYFKWKSEELYERLQHEGRIKDSAFKELVNYRELCSLCQHGSFVKK